MEGSDQPPEGKRNDLVLIWYNVDPIYLWIFQPRYNYNCVHQNTTTKDTHMVQNVIHGNTNSMKRQGALDIKFLGLGPLYKEKSGCHT